MSYNEAETRYYLIDPVLRDKGYDDASKLKLETPAPVEAIGHKGRRGGAGRTDYLLCVQTPDAAKPLPVGVLEAKKENADPLQGMQQAKGYAECSRFHVQYVFATNGHLYGEFDKTTGLQHGPHPFKEHFLTHAELTQRYFNDTGIDLNQPEADSAFSWTVDFAARRAKASDDMQPFIDEANRLTEELLTLKEELKTLKKDKAEKDLVTAAEDAIKAKEKAIREAQTKASDIDAAVYDLKAVNPNVKAVTDTRTVHRSSTISTIRARLWRGQWRICAEW
jgi:hypothetical protein